jgi:hypothetical protein
VMSAGGVFEKLKQFLVLDKVVLVYF